MAKMSRDKGKVGERQVVTLAKPFFPDAERDWRTPQPNGDIRGIPSTYCEVRRRETLAIEAWSLEAELAAGEKIPLVAYRRNGQPWRGSMPLETAFRLIEIAYRHGELVE